MIILETYDTEIDDTLPDECLEEIEAILNKYGYELDDIESDRVIFKA